MPKSCKDIAPFSPIEFLHFFCSSTVVPGMPWQNSSGKSTAQVWTSCTPTFDLQARRNQRYSIGVHDRQTFHKIFFIALLVIIMIYWFVFILPFSFTIFCQMFDKTYSAPGAIEISSLFVKFRFFYIGPRGGPTCK